MFSHFFIEKIRGLRKYFLEKFQRDSRLRRKLNIISSTEEKQNAYILKLMGDENYERKRKEMIEKYQKNYERNTSYLDSVMQSYAAAPMRYLESIKRA